MKKRNKIDIIYDILKVIKESEGKMKTTHLIYKSNLSYKILKLYIKELVQRDLIMEINEKNKKSYLLTDKSKKFLQDYNMIQNFMKSYGL